MSASNAGRWNSVARSLIVGGLAGVVCAGIAVFGDRGNDTAVTFASGFVPYVVVVVLLGLTAPTAAAAMIRAGVSQVLMVLGYAAGQLHPWQYLTQPGAGSLWLMISVSGVPIAAVTAYGVKWLLAPRCARVIRGSADDD